MLSELEPTGEYPASSWFLLRQTREEQVVSLSFGVGETNCSQGSRSKLFTKFSSPRDRD